MEPLRQSDLPNVVALKYSSTDVVGNEPDASNTNSMSASGAKSCEGPHPHPIHANSQAPDVEYVPVVIEVAEHPSVVVHE